MNDENVIFNYYQKEIRKFKGVSADKLREYVEAFQRERNPNLLQPIFEATCKLASKVAHQFVYSNVPIEDLIGTANEAIIAAANKWTKDWPNIGQFFAYEMYNSVRKFISREAYTMRIPTQIVTDLKKTRKEIDVAQLMGEPFAPDDNYHKFFDCGVSRTDEIDFVEEEPYEDPLENLKPHLYKLPSIQKLVLLSLYFDKKGIRQTTKELNMAKKEIYEIEEMAIKNLKTRMTKPMVVKNAKGFPNVKKTRKGQRNTAERNALASKILKVVMPKGAGASSYGTKWMNKDGELKKVKKEDVEGFLADGWQLGFLKELSGSATKGKGTKWMSKEGKSKQVLPEELDAHMQDGWKIGKISNSCWVKRGNESKNIKKDDLQFYLKSGWSKGRVRNQCWVTRNGENKCVELNELNVYLKIGWSKGRVINNSNLRAANLLI